MSYCRVRGGTRFIVAAGKKDNVAIPNVVGKLITILPFVYVSRLSIEMIACSSGLSRLFFAVKNSSVPDTRFTGIKFLVSVRVQLLLSPRTIVRACTKG